MLPVHVNDPLLTFGRSRSGTPAAMQLAAVPTSNGGILARPADPVLCPASAPWPIWPETGFDARFDKGCVVS